jgi:hypothetical protein
VHNGAGKIGLLAPRFSEIGNSRPQIQLSIGLICLTDCEVLALELIICQTSFSMDSALKTHRAEIKCDMCSWRSNQ